MALVFLFVSLLAGPASADRPDVLILESGSARPYRLARESLEKALPPTIRVQRIQIDPEEIGEGRAQIRAIGARVLAPFGSQATSFALEHGGRAPVVFAMVLHPVQSGLLPSLERPGPRVTGAVLDLPARRSFETLRGLLGARRVGILYDPAQTGRVVAEARASAAAAGVELVTVAVPDSAELPRALESLERLDALWSVPDRTVLAGGAAEQILLYTLRQRIPFMGLSEEYVRAGALLALAVDYEENGRQAAERIVRVLDGEPPGRIPIARPQRIEVVYNGHTASRLGIEFPARADGDLRAVR